MGYITWIQWVIIAIVLLVLYLALTRTKWLGGMIKHIPIEQDALKRYMVAIIAFLFLLINPMLHAVLIAGAAFIFYASEKLFPKKKHEIVKAFYPMTIKCKIDDNTRLKDVNHTIERCLYSTSYLALGHAPIITNIEDGVEISVRLLSKKYANSLMVSLRSAGLFPTIIQQ